MSRMASSLCDLVDFVVDKARQMSKYIAAFEHVDCISSRSVAQHAIPCWLEDTGVISLRNCFGTIQGTVLLIPLWFPRLQSLT